MTSYQQPNIDLALEGLKNPLDGLRAADEAARLTDFSVDLVELDRLEELLARTKRVHPLLMQDIQVFVAFLRAI